MFETRVSRGFGISPRRPGWLLHEIQAPTWLCLLSHHLGNSGHCTRCLQGSGDLDPTLTLRRPVCRLNRLPSQERWIIGFLHERLSHVLPWFCSKSLPLTSKSLQMTFRSLLESSGVSSDHSYHCSSLEMFRFRTMGEVTVAWTKVH